MRRSPVLLAAAAMLIAAVGASELPDQPARDHDITVDDYFTIATILDVAVSPDGRAAPFIENRWEPPAEKRNADLWTVDLASRELHRLSFDAASESSPTWSPDGRFIYYTAEYSRPGSETPPWDGSTQVWRIAAAGGEPQAVTRVAEGVSHYRLAHDGRSLIYAVGSEQTDDEWKELREKFDELEYGHGVTTFPELWTVDLQSWRATRLVDATRVITSADLAADGVRLEPTPVNYARAYAQEGGEPAPTASDGGALAGLIGKLVRGVERGGRHWTAARRKDSLQRVLEGSRSDAKRLQQRLTQLAASWDSDTPDAGVETEPVPLDTLETPPPAAASPAFAMAVADDRPWGRIVGTLGETTRQALPPDDAAAQLSQALAGLVERIGHEGASTPLAEELEAMCRPRCRGRTAAALFRLARATVVRPIRPGGDKSSGAAGQCPIR